MLHRSGLLSCRVAPREVSHQLCSSLPQQVCCTFAFADPFRCEQSPSAKCITSFCFNDFTHIVMRVRYCPPASLPAQIQMWDYGILVCFTLYFYRSVLDVSARWRRHSVPSLGIALSHRHTATMQSPTSEWRRCSLSTETTRRGCLEVVQ